MIRDIKSVTTEIIKNSRRMWRLAKYEQKATNKNTVLGFLWNFLNPAIQIFIYWFVFAVGLNSAQPKGGYSHIVWMICGIIPWFYISSLLTSTTTSICGYSGILKRMSFPMAIVPVKTVLSGFLSHIYSMIIVIFICILGGAKLHINNLYLVYFMIATIVFLVAYAMLFSAITVLVRDVQKLISSLTRLLFYISPVVWVQDNLPLNIRYILRLNPIDYLINGYRNSILYPENIDIINYQTLWFWFLTITLFAVGCKVHMKLKKEFFDLI